MKTYFLFTLWLLTIIVLSFWLNEPKDNIPYVLFWALMVLVNTILLYFHCKDDTNKSDNDES